MSFRLVPKSVTLNDRERRNGGCHALFHRIRELFRRISCVKVVADTPKFSVAEYLLRYSRRLRRTSVTHDSLRYINILTYLLTYLLCIDGRMRPAFVIRPTILLTHWDCYFHSISTTSLISHDEMFVNFRQHLLLKCCYLVTEFSKPVPTHNRVDQWQNLCTSLLYCVYDVVIRKTTESDRQANPNPKPYLLAVQYGGLASS